MRDKPLILVVEDEPIVALDLQQALQRLGYEVPSPLNTGEEVLARLPELRPDLVLMDIHLAGALDGIETARRLWTDSRVPVVYLTAYSTREVVQRATASEPFGYLTKPYSPGALGSTIEVALYKHRMAEELQQAHDLLEERVAERTAELRATNARLQEEALERRRVEAELRQAKEAA
ncbi:MAG: response regulator, partial [Candidatus Latescibacterota bacterium]